jgi:hypothetical protein
MSGSPFALSLDQAGLLHIQIAGWLSDLAGTARPS